MVLPKRCLYGKCKNTDKTNDDESAYLVPFPKIVTARTRSRVEKWVKACGKNGVSMYTIENHYDRCFVCSTHFVGGDGPTKLNPDPIPFVPEQEPLQVKLFKNQKACAVSDCASVSSKDDLISFHPFPKHHIQLELWKTVLKLDKDPPRSRNFVCSKHFISGIKSDFSSHPDYIPSIFASSTVSEIKALRLKLKEYESGYAKLRMERNCASLRKHWFECGFARTELTDGVRRVKSQKRKQAAEEKFAVEAKKRREMEAEALAERRREESAISENLQSKNVAIMDEVKEENESDYEGQDDEFIIENDRAEEGEEDCDEDFDLSRVKEEPVEDSEIPRGSKDSSGNSPGSSYTGRQDGAFSNAEGSKCLMSEHEIKSEPLDEEYDKAESPGMDRVTGDFCDEMLTVHFGSQCSSNTKLEDDVNNDVDGTLTVQNMGYQSNQDSSFTQSSSTKQNLGIQGNLQTYNQPTYSIHRNLQHSVAEHLYTTPSPSLQSSQQNTGIPLPITSQAFGLQCNAQNSLTQPLFTNLNLGFQSDLHTTVSRQANQNNCVTPVPLLNLSLGYPSSTYNVFGQTYQPVQFMGMDNLHPFVMPQCTATTAGVGAGAGAGAGACVGAGAGAGAGAGTPCSASTNDVKTVCALDPNTYQSPIVGQTTFVVPKENVINLAIDGGPGKEETLSGSSGAQSVQFNPVGQSQKEVYKTWQQSQLHGISGDGAKIQNQLSRTSSIDSAQNSCHLSCDEVSQDSVSSSEYQPSAGVSETSSETSRPASCDVDSMFSRIMDENVIKTKNIECDASSEDSLLTEMVKQSKSNDQISSEESRFPTGAALGTEPSSLKTLGTDPDSIESSVVENVQEVYKNYVQNKMDTTCQPLSYVTNNISESSTQTDLPSTQESGSPNSKMCQTKVSISKEATLRRQLSMIGVEVTSDQFRYLLKQKLYPSGMCPSMRRVRKCVSNCSVQAEMDKYVIPDLSNQCTHLAKEVKQHKQKLQSLTYDFLTCGTSKTHVLCHTGCYTVNTLKELFEYVSVCLESPPVDDLSQFQEFVMTLMKLRLGLHNQDLAFRFEVETSVVPEILTKWFMILVNTLSHLIHWPDQEPERTEHRNQRWRLLKLRYDLLQAYDGIESMKDKWLLEQDLDDMIKVCDVLNSFQAEDKRSETPADIDLILRQPVQYFIEEILVDDSDDECSNTSTSTSEQGGSDDVTKVLSDVSKVLVSDCEKSEEASQEKPPFTSMEIRDLSERDDTKNSHSQKELTITDDSHEEAAREHSSDNGKKEEKSPDNETESDVEGGGTKDFEEDLEMPIESTDEDLVLDKNVSLEEKDTKTSEKRSKHQKVSCVYYVDDSDGILIGAPEMEVEVWDSEIDVTFGSRCSVDT